MKKRYTVKTSTEKKMAGKVRFHTIWDNENNCAYNSTNCEEDAEKLCTWLNDDWETKKNAAKPHELPIR